MSNPFFDHPILNSPYECPRRHWELDSQGQPTQRILENRKYLPDFIVLVDDGRPPHPDGTSDLLHLVVEIKGYRREDAKEKKSTMETYWVPGVNNLRQCGRWAFAEFTEVYQIETDFAAKVESEFNKMIAQATQP